jgi:hypothetical protein
MSIELKQIALPKTTRLVASKYNFGSLAVGGPALVDDEVIDRAKAQSRITSALVAYRARTGDKSKFSVRVFKQEDGTDAVGVWKTADAPVATA